MTLRIRGHNERLVAVRGGYESSKRQSQNNRRQEGTGPKHSRHHMAVFVPPGTFIASHPNEIETTYYCHQNKPMLAADDNKTKITPKQEPPAPVQFY